MNVRVINQQQVRRLLPMTLDQDVGTSIDLAGALDEAT